MCLSREAQILLKALRGEEKKYLTEAELDELGKKNGFNPRRARRELKNQGLVYFKKKKTGLTDQAICW